MPDRTVTDPERWGVSLGYHDAAGNWREPPPSTLEAILSSMGAAGDPDEALDVLTVRLDHPLPPVPVGRLELESGGAVDLDGSLPPDVPTGYHRLVPGSGRAVRLIVSPGRCPLPPGREWGWAAQLYAARSGQSWGIGDLADLRRLGRWSTGLGAGLMLLNPLHAPPPLEHQEPSPYFASSRCFSNPIYLRVEEVPGAASVAAVDRLAPLGRALDSERRIDRDRVWALKSEALEAIFAGFSGDPEFDRYRATRGEALTGYATWCALAEVHGLPWTTWPASLQRPDSAAVAAFVRSSAGARRVAYHAWLQWLLDRQLAGAAESIGLVQDLAIGVDAGGADAWLWQEVLSSGMRVGAPPDAYNALGQDWGLPPWDPWKLRAAGYGPFVETVRAGMRHGAGLRFDHVMGLFRLFWIPEGAEPTAGTYVRYPYWDLLNILALEAERAGAYVVGEDLGTVEEHVRPELAERQVLSYRLLWFEPKRPPAWPELALGAVTTHDLPTVAGVWNGTDFEAQRAAGLAASEEGAEALRTRLADWTGVAAGASASEVVDASYRVLADAPCYLLTATLDDVAVVEERPNMPGTVDEWPNWSIALPVSLEELERLPMAQRIAASLGRQSMERQSSGRQSMGRQSSGRHPDAGTPGPSPRVEPT
ncbi:MAG: 4-alpha-glucanotransferase [Acidimicrobiaceae bacterium]|nr:4-alpha-glucanotransferase [Acidimicrobiaceae bacterium]